MMQYPPPKYLVLLSWLMGTISTREAEEMCRIIKSWKDEQNEKKGNS